LSNLYESRMNVKNDKMYLLHSESHKWKRLSKKYKIITIIFTDLDIAKAWVATRIRHSFSSSYQRKSLLFYHCKIDS